MLPRNCRVRTPAEFSETLHSGARAGRRNVVVSADLSESDPQAGVRGPGARAGFIVSKAVGNAVVRNKVKRRLRAAVAEQIAGPLRGYRGARLVIRALPPSGTAEWPELREDVDSAIRSALRKAERRAGRWAESTPGRPAAAGGSSR